MEPELTARDRVKLIQSGSVGVTDSYGTSRVRAEQALVNCLGVNKNRRAKKYMKRLALKDAVLVGVEYKSHRGNEVRERLKAKLAAKASAASSTNPQ